MLLHPLSKPVPLPDFDVFGVPNTQASIEKGYFSTHYATTAPKFDQIIEFDFQTSDQEYVHFDKMILGLNVKVTITPKDDPNRDLTETEKSNIALVNYPLESIFKQKDLYINNKAVTTSQGTNAYRSIFDVKLGHSKGARESWMTAAGYEPSINPADMKYTDTNKHIKNGKEYDLKGVLHFDLSFQERAMIGGPRFSIRLTPNKPEFYLLFGSTVNVNVEFTQARLDVWRSKVTGMLLQAHAAALQQAPAKYPIVRTDVKSILLTAGGTTAHIDHAISGQLPTRLFLGFVSNMAFNGDKSLDPFNLKHYNIEFISVIGPNGQTPQSGYRPDFTSGKELIADSLIGLYVAAGQLCDCPKMSIDRKTFIAGETIFGFSLSPDLSEGCSFSRHTNTVNFGNLRIEVVFKEPLPESVNMIIYSQYDNIISIDKDHNVTTDYQ